MYPKTISAASEKGEKEMDKVIIHAAWANAARNAVTIICFTFLSVYFGKWWIALIGTCCLSSFSFKRSDDEKPYSGTMMECSICNRHTARHKFAYCPHCGAKMKERENHES